MTVRQMLEQAADAWERGDAREALRLLDEARYRVEGEVQE